MNGSRIFSGKKKEAPSHPKKPVDLTQHGKTRRDAYAWMRDPNWQDVLRDPAKLSPDIRAALDAENVYYDALTDDLEPLRETLLAEMRGRIHEDDQSVPMKDGPFLYWTRHRDGGEYPIFLRRPVDNADQETVLFDGDKEADGHKFFDIAAIDHSPDHRLLAIAIDNVGSEYYEITVRDIESGKAVGAPIKSADGGGVEWAADSNGFFYIERDDHQRAKFVKYHRLGDDPAADRLVYEEPDDMFYMSLSKSQDGRFVFINATSITSSECRAIRADDPMSAPLTIEPRTEKLEYSVDHHGDHFYILTNADGATDFKIVTAPVNDPSRGNWRDWVDHEEGRYILSFIPYQKYFVRLERRNALPTLVINDYRGAEYDIEFDEAAYAIGVDAGFEYETQSLRFSYSSPSTPRQEFDFDMGTRARTLLKTQHVPSGHDPSLYAVDRFDAISHDGARVPVTVVRLRATPIDGSAPLLLYGYGAYGITIPAGFSTNILSLVDRGVIYAIVHPRGGAARGRQWYLDGKLSRKMNSFRDFIAGAENLIEKNYTAAGKIVIHGGSAGGLLVGATVNLRPELFAGVIAAVPFVDVINTISDGDLPLTPPEWEEWGNPIQSATEYDWIAEYSPYDNVRRVDYPPIMATGGLTDYRVTYWEPAKWIARLRDEGKGGPFVLRMNMGAGHAGSAARFEQLDERAHLYAFALKVLGAQETPPVQR